MITYDYIYIYIYVYISLSLYIYIYVYMYVYIYIYIYTVKFLPERSGGNGVRPRRVEPLRSIRQRELHDSGIQG